MSEFHDRLWPSEQDQPKWETVVNNESYVLLWTNTTIQVYRTGLPEYDDELKKYDHVIHKYLDEGSDEGWIVLTFQQIGPEGLTYLLNNGYPHRVDPIPEYYALAWRADIESSNIPESIGPDFGQSAAA